MYKTIKWYAARVWVVVFSTLILALAVSMVTQCTMGALDTINRRPYPAFNQDW